jgi:hypothetical protein
MLSKFPPEIGQLSILTCISGLFSNISFDEADS